MRNNGREKTFNTQREEQREREVNRLEKERVRGVTRAAFQGAFSSCFVTPLCRSGTLTSLCWWVACQLVFGRHQGSLRKVGGEKREVGADQVPLPPPLSMALRIRETQFAEWSSLPHTLGSALSLATCNTCEHRASLS